MSTPTSASGSAYGGAAAATAHSASSSSGGGFAALSPSGTGLPPPAPLNFGAGTSPSSSSAAAAAAAGGASTLAAGTGSAPASGPASVRSAAGSPRPKFDTDTLSTFLRAHLASRLASVSWNARDKERTRALTSSLAQAAKTKMLEIAPRGFKFVVNVQLVENLGQGGRGDMACHWEESDQVVQELFSNDRILCTVTCFAIRAF